MKKLASDISNGIIKNIYLLCGSQSYLRNQYRDKLVKLITNGDEMNYSYFEGSGADLVEIIGITETMPFLADRRVIVVENAGFFNSGNDKLAKYLENIPETSVLIFSEEKTDSKLKQYKVVDSLGTVAKFNDLSDDELKRWVLDRLSREHRRITGQALQKFLDGCGDDMMLIRSELDKLISYTYGKDGIYPEDVEAICSFQVEDKIFQMLDAIFAHDANKALKYYGDLLTLQHAPQQTLALIEGQLRFILHVKMLDNDHASIQQMKDDLGVKKDFRIKKALPIARKSSKIWLMNALDMCANTDAASKSGRMNAQIGLETVIMDLIKI